MTSSSGDRDPGRRSDEMAEADVTNGEGEFDPAQPDPAERDAAQRDPAQHDPAQHDPAQRDADEDAVREAGSDER